MYSFFVLCCGQYHYRPNTIIKNPLMTSWAGVDHSPACTRLGRPWVSRVGGWGGGLGGNGGEGGQAVMHWPFYVCHAPNHNNLGRGMAASRHLQSLMRIALSTASNPELPQEKDLGESSSSLAKMTPYKPPHSSIAVHIPTPPSASVMSFTSDFFKLGSKRDPHVVFVMSLLI